MNIDQKVRSISIDDLFRTAIREMAGRRVKMTIGIDVSSELREFHSVLESLPLSSVSSDWPVIVCATPENISPWPSRARPVLKTDCWKPACDNGPARLTKAITCSVALASTRSCSAQGDIAPGLLYFALTEG
jgi:hypothetical protein